MKITLKETTIEADAKELRECRTLTDGLIALLKSVLPMGDEAKEPEEIGGLDDGEQDEAD